MSLNEGGLYNRRAFFEDAPGPREGLSPPRAGHQLRRPPSARRRGRRAYRKEVVMNIDLEQARKRAKELVKAGRAAKLADAQREIARSLGYPGWSALVHALE